MADYGSPRLAAVGAAMEIDDPGSLESHLSALDRADWQELERMIGTAPARSVRAARDRPSNDSDAEVIIVPGQMASDLGVVEGNDPSRLLWFDPLALTTGGLAMLRLPLDGSPPEHQIVAGGPLKLYYLPLQRALGQRWRTRVFPYDWRQDITVTADRLKDELSAASGTVHLVAHSTGGLVCRMLMSRHPAEWARLGGRLVMVGTPNFGSFMAALAMTGKDPKLRLLSLIDPTLRKREVSTVVGTFAGVVQSLASPNGEIDADVDVLYTENSWHGTPVKQVVLDRAREVQDTLEDAIDDSRMVCIGGYGHQTVDGIRLDGNRFSYRRSRAGDGSVPNALSRLPGVPSYWSPARHGELVRDDRVLLAIDDILADGETTRLASGEAPPRTRDGGAPEWVTDADLHSDANRATVRVHSSGRSADALGDILPAIGAKVLQVPIRMEVVWAGIGEADADAIAVGHYIDVYPTAAELALDKAISGDVEDRRRVLHAATARGVLKGNLGDVFTVPWQRPGERHSNVLVMGLGRPGTFQLPQHEVLIRNMVWAAERVVQARTLATVLIGAGAGNLSIEAALASFLRSLDAAVGESELTGRLELIRIVESDLGRARSILHFLTRQLESRDRASSPAVVDVVPELTTGEGGEVSVETVLEALMRTARSDTAETIEQRLSRIEPNVKVGRAMRELLEVNALSDVLRDEFAYVVSRRNSDVTIDVPTRISVLEQDGRLIASAVSDSSTVPERDFGIGVVLFNELVDLANRQAQGDPEVAGRMLVRVAIRPEFRPLLEVDRNVVIEVDRTTATLPWEVLGSDASATVTLRPLGLRTPVARQLRTRHSPPPSVTGRVVLTRALVIGDPGGEAGRLPGAAHEAVTVATALKLEGIEFDFLLGPTDGADVDRRWHPRAATLANVLHHLLHDEYQLVHYAGHGTFSTAESPNDIGWQLADGLLTASHLAMIERLPPLVVANACHSSRVSTGLPGLADEFMGRGVRNLVGTARTVDDESARRFSQSFYSCLLGDGTSGANAPTLGDSVLAGRRVLHEHELPDWDVYQLYGDPLFRFWPEPLGRTSSRIGSTHAGRRSG